MLGETPATLKYWEKEFPRLKPRTSPGGTRQYSAQDIEKLRVIQSLLRDRGLTIQGAKDELRQHRPKLEEREHALSRLEAVLSRLRSLYDSLD